VERHPEEDATGWDEHGRDRPRRRGELREPPRDRGQGRLEHDRVARGIEADTVSGLGADSQPVHRLAISDDGGATGTEHLLALGTNELQARVLEVDPTDPDRVYVKVEATSEEYPERLIVSQDGGRSFSTALTLQGFRGFALSTFGKVIVSTPS